MPAAPRTSSQLARRLPFWAILVVVAALVAFYRSWPWRETAWLFPLAVFEFTHATIGLLFLIPIALGIVFLWWKRASLIWLLCLAAALPFINLMSPNFQNKIFNIGVFVFPLSIMLLVAVELGWRRRARQEAAEREAERQMYLGRLLTSQEEERRRIAQELHDRTVQVLLSATNRSHALATAGQEMPISEVRKHGEWLRDTLQEAAKDVRRISLDLRPSVLDTMGLVPAIAWLLDNCEKDHKIVCAFEIHGTERQITSNRQASLFRIVQEAVSNVQKHAGASKLEVKVEFLNDSVKIVIRDNGRGFPFDQALRAYPVVGKMGLTGMHERVRLLGGSLSIEPTEGHGTKVVVEAPY